MTKVRFVTSRITLNRLAVLCVVGAFFSLGYADAQAWRPTSAQARYTASGWAYDTWCTTYWYNCTPDHPGVTTYAWLPANNAVGEHSRRVSTSQKHLGVWHNSCVRVEHYVVAQVYDYNNACPYAASAATVAR